ncbi:ABC transporter ATP-binding protein [Nakamurella flavida]|uniref:ABC transporter ATP-binding protein n=1 Tax=Nakamurella flavida TaxID=363630 RepID=A0A938YDF0_9ACTN|nr:ABC transporter ATP-binding protein [Nakamurella flavida]MBM9475625.1 ABC transporter ATP-binding protein [Nakamurella flavida]MDP9778099.1 ATP-binding cassette subfamily B protein [Nakamurella flavida]
MTTTAPTPLAPPAQHPAGPSSTPSSQGTVRPLLRLLPWVRPALPALGFSALAAGLATGCALVIPLVLQQIVDGPIGQRDASGIWPLALILLALGVGEAVLFWLRRLIIARPIMRAETRMRNDLFDRLQALPVSFHDQWPAGQLLSRAVSDLATIRRFLLFGVVFLVVNVITFVAGVGILLALSWPLGLIVGALALPLVVLCFSYESRYQLLARRSQDQVGDLATTVEESVLGIRILKSFGRGRHLGARFGRQAADLRTTELGKARVVSRLWATIIVLPEVAIGAALCLGIWQVAQGTVSLGTLVAFFGVSMILRWPVESLGWLMAMANDAASAATRYFEVMDAPVPITSPEHPVPAHRPARGRLEFRDVHFAFPDASAGQELLRGVDLVVEPGETVAVVGATGSGKTALTSLVNRLYDVTSGAVSIDGVDVRAMSLDDLRELVSVAFEEPTLFSASVRENIVLGRPDADDAAVRRALQVAQAEFVDDLPWGWQTRIGEQGLSLSGGQRQRLALARAVLGGPALLVLDDPLSALDIHTESLVEQALRSVLADTTAVIVAHRASTVMLADRVALLADGRITAVGTHSELMETVPAYRSLLTSEPYAPGPDDTAPHLHTAAGTASAGGHL